MGSLSERIDHLTRNTRTIKNTASYIANSLDSGPFTRAVLNTPLGDLIRDIDPSELGLFTLARPPTTSIDNDARTTQNVSIKRVEFTGATPLRGLGHKEDKKSEVEPELYARAALKYIDRYNTIRPMPRAFSQVSEILKQLENTRLRIASLTEVSSVQSSETTSSKTQADIQERYINELQLKISELRKRKQDALKQNEKLRKSLEAAYQPREIRSPASPPEDQFWNTPSALPRTLTFNSDSLIDEYVDFADTSANSFSISVSSPSNMNTIQPAIYQEPSSSALSSDSPGKLKLASGSPDFSSIADVPEKENNILRETYTDLTSPNNLTSTHVDVIEAPSHQSITKVKVTNEVERIVFKIWNTMGDILIPGSSFNNVAPCSKEIIADLQKLASFIPMTSSPSISSSSSTTSAVGVAIPTFQSILTAHLLMTLLLSPPSYAIPLNQAKVLLASKAAGTGSTGSALGQSTTRILYGCVAKRLVKIDRGGGEQIVKFDI